ncbi:MAG: hypothetical protein WA102_08240 [Candidatus Methanoperedens sp.]
MRNKILLTALVVGIALIGIVSANVHLDRISKVDSITQNTNIDVKINVGSPVVPDKVSVYRVAEAIVSQNEAILTAKDFSFTSNPVVITYPTQPENKSSPMKTKYLFKNGNEHFGIDASSNAITYAKNDKVMKPSASLPPESEAIKIAQEFLKSHSITLNDASIETETIYLNKLNVETNQILDKIPMMVQVKFRRNINGMPVVGPGGKVIVDVGNNGEPIYLFKNWRQLEPAGTSGIIPFSRAVEKLSRLEVKDVPVTPLKSIEIVGAKLGYYEADSTEEQKVYTPVWIFDVKNSIGTERISLYVDALN